MPDGGFGPKGQNDRVTVLTRNNLFQVRLVVGIINGVK